MPHAIIFLLSLALGMVLATASFAGVTGVQDMDPATIRTALLVLAGLLALRCAP